GYKADVAADRSTVSTDKGIVAGYKSDVAADKATVAADKATTLGYKNAADADKVATAADRVQTGLDKTATAADRVQTGLDKTATAADRVQTGLDKTATAADRVQTGQDKVATAADRVQTGLDRTAAAASAAAAAGSAGSVTPVEAQIHAATVQVVADADEIGFTRSAASWALGKLTWATLKSAIKTYIQSSALSITGTLSATGNIQSGPAGTNGSVILQNGTSIEIGAGRTADGLAFLDFSAVSGADYNARIIRNAGANGDLSFSNLGTGTFGISSGGTLSLNGVAAGLYYNGVRVYTLTENDARYVQPASINYGAGSAALAFGAVGSYALVFSLTATALTEGMTVAGSTLQPGGWVESVTSDPGDDVGFGNSGNWIKGGTALAGTWMICSRVGGSASVKRRFFLAKRVS
ncbi:hypothetical protein EOC06_17710, partial [Mesorhizobium sp. M7A.F.Ca.MR.362.00.0.0]